MISCTKNNNVPEAIKVLTQSKGGCHSCEVRKMTLIRCFAVSKIVQIEKEEEEEVKEEIVTKAMMMQHFESDSRLKLNSNYEHSRKSRN